MILQIIISNGTLDLVTGSLAKISLGTGIWAKFRLGTGIWYPPLRPSFLVVSLVLQPALQCPKQPTERSLHNRRTLSARQVTSDVENRIWRIPCHLEDMCIMLVSGHSLKNDLITFVACSSREPYLAFSWMLHITTTGIFWSHSLLVSVQWFKGRCILYL